MSGGIYAIQHLHTGAYYIGSARNFAKRFGWHRSALRRGEHNNRHLQAIHDEHGIDGLTFDVLEIVSADRELTAREQWWLDTMLPLGGALNIARFANSVRGIPNHTPRWRAAMSEMMKARTPKLHSPETRAKMSATRLAKGFRHSEETKQRIAEAHRGNKHALGVKLTDEQRAAISDRMRGNRNGVGRVLTPEGIERIRAARISYWAKRRAA